MNDTPITKKTSEPIAVLCTRPVTLLIRVGEALSSAGRAPSYVDLKLERGINILAGTCTIGGNPVYIELAHLPRHIAALPKDQREAKIVAALDDYAKAHPGHKDLLARDIVARGTIAELVKGPHYLALREAASNSTNRLSLQALHDHPAADPAVKQLATVRLAAWRQEDAA